MIALRDGYPRHDHRPRLPRARAGRHERRPREARRHDRRVDRRRAPASASAASRARSEALTDIALPAARAALESAGVDAADDRPDHRRDGDAGHDVPGERGADRRRARHAHDAAAYDLSAGCTGFMYALAQAYGMVAAGLVEARARRRRRRALEDPRLERPLDARPLRRRRRRGRARASSNGGGFLGFELGADGAGGVQPLAAGQRLARTSTDARRAREDERPRGLQVRDARAGLVGARSCSPSAARPSTTSTSTCRTRRTCGSSTTRRASSASRTRRSSSTSTATGTRRRARSRWRSPTRPPTGGCAPGELVLMTGMGAGLTWGSALIEWTEEDGSTT